MGRDPKMSWNRVVFSDVMCLRWFLTLTLSMVVMEPRFLSECLDLWLLCNLAADM